MTASENKEIVRKLRRAAEGNLPDWAQMPISMGEVADLILLVDTITDLRKHEEIRAQVIRERNAERSALQAQVAELEALLGEVLRTFVHAGHPGRACLQSGWIPVEQVARWRSALKTGGDRPWCGAPRDLGGQQPCPLAEPCDIYTCRIGSAAGNEVYRPEPPGGEGGSRGRRD